MKLRPLTIVLVLAGCTTEVPLSAFDDALRETHIRTVAIEEGFSLYSPYDLALSRQLAEVVEENLAAVTATLGVELDEPVHVHAYPEELLGLGSAPVRSHAVEGFSNQYGDDEPPTIVILVSLEKVSGASSEEDQATFFVFNYAGIIRHELGHLISSAYVPDAPTWFQEGLALELEYSHAPSGTLVPDAWPQTLQIARKAQAEHTLAEVLDWREDVESIAAGDAQVFQAGRPLSHSYMRFLLERRGGDRSMESFRAIHDMQRAEHLSLEDEWRVWLVGGAGGSAE